MKKHYLFKIILITLLFAFQYSFAVGQRIIKVAAFDDYPLIFRDKDGSINGLYVDLLKEVGKKENIRFEFVPGTWQDGLDRIRSGEVDMLTDVGYTVQRSLYMDYGKTPIRTFWGELYTGKTSGISSLFDFKYKTIGVLKGDIFAENFKELSSKFDLRCQIIELESYEDVFKAIADKKIEAGVAAGAVKQEVLRKYDLKSTGFVFSPLDVFFTTSKGKNNDLMLILDKYLNEWKYLENSPLARAKEKWLLGSVGTVEVIPGWIYKALIIFGIILAASSIFILLMKIQVKKATDKINNLLTEKELLLKEVHHRIKNNMNTIKGLLTLQIEAEENPSATASLRDAESRVQSMIMLYDRLYCTENYREFSVRDYLTALAEEIIGSFPNRGIVKVETKIEDFILNINTLSPLGIIVNELLTNMMKYAFVGRDSGVITISASMKDNRAIVVIQDNGIGIPESVSFEKSKGFGLDLVSMLTEQIGGSIRIERGEGTKFLLEFDV